MLSQVMDEMHLSDHHLITAKIHIRPDNNPICKSRHLKKVEWPRFQALVDAELKDFEDPVIWSPRQMDSVTSELHRGILAALDEVARPL
jgi:hypothetical protein